MTTPPERSSPGSGTLLVEKWERAAETQPAWVLVMFKVIGSVCLLPLVAKVLRTTWVELMTDHADHGHGGGLDEILVGIATGILTGWVLPVLLALLGLTFIIPRIAVPIWKGIWKRLPIPAKYKGGT